MDPAAMQSWAPLTPKQTDTLLVALHGGAGWRPVVLHRLCPRLQQRRQQLDPELAGLLERLSQPEARPEHAWVRACDGGILELSQLGTAAVKSENGNARKVFFHANGSCGPKGLGDRFEAYYPRLSDPGVLQLPMLPKEPVPGETSADGPAQAAAAAAAAAAKQAASGSQQPDRGSKRKLEEAAGGGSQARADAAESDRTVRRKLEEAGSSGTAARASRTMQEGKAGGAGGSAGHAIAAAGAAGAAEAAAGQALAAGSGPGQGRKGKVDPGTGHASVDAKPAAAEAGAGEVGRTGVNGSSAEISKAGRIKPDAAAGKGAAAAPGAGQKKVDAAAAAGKGAAAAPGAGQKKVDAAAAAGKGAAAAPGAGQKKVDAAAAAGKGSAAAPGAGQEEDAAATAVEGAAAAWDPRAGQEAPDAAATAEQGAAAARQTAPDGAAAGSNAAADPLDPGHHGHACSHLEAGAPNGDGAAAALKVGKRIKRIMFAAHSSAAACAAASTGDAACATAPDGACAAAPDGTAACAATPDGAAACAAALNGACAAAAQEPSPDPGVDDNNLVPGACMEPAWAGTGTAAQAWGQHCAPGAPRRSAAAILDEAFGEILRGMGQEAAEAMERLQEQHGLLVQRLERQALESLGRVHEQAVARMQEDMERRAAAALGLVQRRVEELASEAGVAERIAGRSQALVETWIQELWHSTAAEV